MLVEKIQEQKERKWVLLIEVVWSVCGPIYSIFVIHVYGIQHMRLTQEGKPYILIILQFYPIKCIVEYDLTIVCVDAVECFAYGQFVRAWQLLFEVTRKDQLWWASQSMGMDD